TLSSATPGTYNVVVTGKGTSGGVAQTHSVTVTLLVPGFSLAASPSSLTVARRGSGTFTVTVSPSGGFTSPVNLSVSGLPNGATASFSPAVPAPGASSTLTITADQNAKLGTFPLTVSGAGDGLTRTTSVTLVIINK